MPKTIVVIDDEHPGPATLNAVLLRRGCDVRVGPNASQGREKVAEVKPKWGLRFVVTPLFSTGGKPADALDGKSIAK